MKTILATFAVLTLMAALLATPAYSEEDHAAAHGTTAEGTADISSKIGFVSGSFSAQRPTGEISVLSLIHSLDGVVYSDEKTFEETKTFKLDLHAIDNDKTIVIDGHLDHHAVPDPYVPTIAGIDLLAIGLWNVEDSSFPTSQGQGTVEVKLITTAWWRPVDPTHEDVWGQSEAYAKDPFYFHPLGPGESIQLDSTFHAGQAFRGTGSGVASKQVFAGTDIPGYETLYQLDITAHEVNDTHTLSVDFVSHPEMGMDNQAIIDQVHQAFEYDPVDQYFVLGSDLTIYDGDLPIPEGIPFELHLDLRASAEVPAPTIIEPPRGDSVIMSPVAIADIGLGADIGVPLTKMNDQSGFVEKFVDGETSFNEFVNNGLLATSQRNLELNYWSTPFRFGGPPTGELVLDFGEQQTFDGLGIWNLTLKQIGICVSETSDGHCEEVGEFVLEEKTGTESAVGPDVLLFDQDYIGRYIRIDVQSLYRPDENSAWFAVVNEIAASVVPPDSGLLGDFNKNGELDANDIDLLTAHVREAGSDLSFDVNFDGTVNHDDLDVWVRNLKNTYFGDADLDGEFNSTDLIKVFQAGKYEDNIPLNASWSDGDWDGNGEFETGDLIKAFQDGGYEKGPRAPANAVPEPSAVLMLLFAASVMIRKRSS